MALHIMFPLFACATSKALAVADIKGIRLQGSQVFDASIVFLRAGASMEIAEPSKPMMPVAFGTWISTTS